MGAVYDCSVVTPAAGAAAPFASFRAGPNNSARIREIHLNLRAPAVTEVGLVWSNNLPSIAQSSVNGYPRNPQADPAASGGIIDTTWTTTPTVAGNAVYIRSAFLASVAGVTAIWTFPEPIIVAANNPSAHWLLLWNVGTGNASALRATFVWEE